MDAMNSLERLQAAFSGRPTDIPPVVVHGYGFYKFQFAGLARDFDAQARCLAMTGLPRAEVEFRFYDRFQPDWIYLETGPFAPPPQRSQRLADGALLAALRKLDSEAAIDDFVAAYMPPAEELLDSAIFSHVPHVVERYGREVFIAMTYSAPSNYIFGPGGLLDFETGLMALAEKPAMVKYLMERFYEANAEFDRALAQTGVHAHISGEAYMAADLVAPATYREVFFEAQRRYYAATTAQGVIPILCFWGDIGPLIGDLNGLAIGGLMMDESKKGFILDVGDIRRQLRPEIVLFGNLDSVGLLLQGSPQDVGEATLAQLEAATAADHGPFVTRNGSPFCPDTPPENIEAMITAARSYPGDARREQRP